MTTIITSQAPDAKPIAISLELTDEWATIIEVPNFEVPEQSFGGGNIIVPGVAEIISPLLVSNITTTTSSVSVRIFRSEIGVNGTHFLIANEIMIPTKDVIAIPLNGQFILTGDRLEVKASADAELNVTLSYTVGQSEQDDVI